MMGLRHEEQEFVVLGVLLHHQRRIFYGAAATMKHDLERRRLRGVDAFEDHQDIIPGLETG